MQLKMLKSKIHRATVTEANVDYEGSITVDKNLLDAAAIRDYEWVNIWNVTRGTRLSTYTLPGKRDSGVICINGAAAHLAEAGDLVIIAAEAFISQAELDDQEYQPIVVLVDENNKIKNTNHIESEKNNISRKEAHRLLGLGDWQSDSVRFNIDYTNLPANIEKAIQMWCDFVNFKVDHIEGNDGWCEFHFTKEFEDIDEWENLFYIEFPKG